MHKVREAMASSGDYPMDGNVHLDEFLLGGREKGQVGGSYKAKKKKAITAVELTDDGKVKRMYAMRIENFTSRSLQYIFVNHISRGAKITTDKWREYRPIAKAYDITQIDSKVRLNQGTAHYDPSNQVLNKDDLFLGKRL